MKKYKLNSTYNVLYSTKFSNMKLFNSYRINFDRNKNSTNSTLYYVTTKVGTIEAND